MFGLSEQEMQNYQDATYDFVVDEMCPIILDESMFMIPARMEDGEKKGDTVFLQQIIMDLSSIIVLTMSRMSYEYAYHQDSIDTSEEDLIKLLHDKYQSVVVNQFIHHGMTFSEDAVNKIVGLILLELPYLYVSIVEGEGFDPDKFIEARLDAYDKYVETNMPSEAEDIDEDGEDFI